MFDIIRKALKALNTVSKPWQITVALLLGMISGFMPMFGIHQLIILFLAFVINVPLGLYFISAALFTLLGALLDPLFDTIGYAVLTLDALQPFFTALYNSPFLLSYFNYTPMTGSFIFALVAAIPAAFVLNRFVPFYQDRVAVWCAQKPVLKWLFKVEKKAKFSPIRWWGAGVYLGVVGILFALVYFLLDPVIRIVLEQSLSAATLREVRIASVDSHLREGKLTVNTIEVAKPGSTKNEVRIGGVVVDFDVQAALQQRGHFEQIVLRSIAFGTQATHREAAGSKLGDEISKQATDTSRAVEKSAQERGSDFAASLPDINEILGREQLGSVKRYEEAKTEIAGMEARYRKRLDQEHYQKEYDEIKAEVDAISKAVQQKDYAALATLPDRVAKVQKKIDTLKKEGEALKSDLQRDRKTLEKIYADAQRFPQEDFNRLRSKYSLDTQGGANLIGLVMGKEYQGYLETALRYYKMAEPYLKSSGDAAEEEEEEAVVRTHGRWVRFPSETPASDWLVYRALFDGTYTDIGFKGTLRDYASSPRLYGKPMVTEAALSSDHFKNGRVRWVSERQQAKGPNRFALNVDEVKLNPIDFGSGVRAENLLADLDFNDTVAYDQQMNGDLLMRFVNADFNIGEVKSEWQKMLAQTLDDVKKFKVEAKISGSVDAPSVSASSDLDRVVSQAMKKRLAALQARYEAELKSALNDKVKEQVDALKAQGGVFEQFADSSNGDISQLDDLELTLKNAMGKGSANDLMEKSGVKTMLDSLGF